MKEYKKYVEYKTLGNNFISYWNKIYIDFSKGGEIVLF